MAIMRSKHKIDSASFTHPIDITANILRRSEKLYKVFKNPEKREDPGRKIRFSKQTFTEAEIL